MLELYDPDAKVSVKKEPILTYSLDEFFQVTPIGSIEKAIGNNLYGINHRQTPTAVPSNWDSYGLTFFVRPQLNLSLLNISALRYFYQLLTNDEFSVQRYVRGILDPRGNSTNPNSIIGGNLSGFNTPVVDNQNCFIPILSNNLTSVSGWPDITAPTFTATEGLYREGWSIVDGVVRNYESFDLDTTFRNTKGDVIIYMMYIWLNYMAEVFEGRLVPYWDYILENTLDYNTRIYRLVLDQNKRFVTKIAATGVSFPIAVSVGQFFDYNAERPYNEQSKEITIRWRSLGVTYFDEILVREFNITVQQFNPSMRNKNNVTKIPHDLLHLFNNRGYPRINPKTFELEWYVPNDLYNFRIKQYLSTVPSQYVGVSRKNG